MSQSTSDEKANSQEKKHILKASSGRLDLVADSLLNEELFGDIRGDSGSNTVNARENAQGNAFKPESEPTTVDYISELNQLEKSGERLNIFRCQNAHLFFIEPNGEVKSTFESCDLVIYKVIGDLTETIFLEVGTWVYPLFPDISPCYRSENGVFIFPDIYSQVEGATVGLVLPDFDALHDVLSELLQSKDEEFRSRRSTATDSAVAVSDNLNRGTSYLAKNLVRASESLAGCLDFATSRVINKIQPSVKPLNPTLTTGARTAAEVTGSVAGMTDYMYSNLGQAVTALGRYISPYVMRTLKKDSVPEKAVHFTLNTLHGIGNIYSGLSESADILTRSVSNNAVKLVEHKYGQPVGSLTSDTLSTVGSIYSTVANMKAWRPKSIVKATLRSAGHAIMEDRRNMMRQEGSHQGSTGFIHDS